MTTRSHLFTFVLTLLLLLVSTTVSASKPTVSTQREAQELTQSLTTIDINDAVVTADAKRFGINIASHDQYGASQILKNVITNPGFEGGEISMLYLVDENPQNYRVQADYWDTNWNNDGLRIGQPDGYWNAAEYEVLSGPARGRTGQITNNNSEDNHYTYYIGNDALTPTQGDAIMMRQLIDPIFHTQTYNEPEVGRPNSDGAWSLRLFSTPNAWTPSWQYNMDTFYRDGDRTANKLFIVDGDWHFEIWAKAETAGDSLLIEFERDGEATFFTETIPLTTSWQKIERDFTVAPGGDPNGNYSPTTGVPHPVISLNLTNNSGRDILIDDIALYRRGQTNPTVFTDKFVDALQELQPGIVRNWGNQLGSSLDNQLSSDQARRPTAFRPHERSPKYFHYSLHEFLELAQHVNAEPWYVVPPTWTAAELENLMAYLSAPTGTHPYADLRANLGQSTPWSDVFSQIHLEFGAELWGSAYAHNDPFVGATLRGGLHAGDVAEYRLAGMDNFASSTITGFDRSKFNFVIGGQHGYPPTNADINGAGSSNDAIGVAPYFGNIQTWLNDSELYQPIFANAQQEATTGNMSIIQDTVGDNGYDADLSIYEINFHSTRGDSALPMNIRNEVYTSMGGALAVPLHMLTYQSDLGIRNQLMWNALGYSFGFDPNNDGVTDYVNLSGGLRDIENTGRKRPTWLGVELVNQAIQGDLITTTQSGDNPTWTQSAINGINAPITVNHVQSFAYKDGNTYSLVLLNLDLTTWHSVNVQPPNPAVSATWNYIATNNIHNDNEDGQVIDITTSTTDLTQSLHLPPYSIHVLEWQDGSVPTAVDLSHTSISSFSNQLVWIIILTALTATTITLRNKRGM